MAKKVFTTRAAENPGPSYTPRPHGPSTFQVAEDIIPIAELKAKLSEVVRGLDTRPRPLVVTLNGKPAAVVMSPREYDRLAYEARFLKSVARGLADSAAGRVISSEELRDRVAARYGVSPKRTRK